MLLLLLACSATPTTTGALTCSAAVSDTISTVVGVDWSTDANATSYVEFGETDAYGLRTPEVAGAEVHLDLLGVPAETDVHWHGVSTVDGVTAECSGVTATGALPDGIPEVTVPTDAAGQDPAAFVIGAVFEGAGARDAQLHLVAYRRDGAIVWYYAGDEGATGMDLHYSRDGSGFLFNQFDGQMGGDGGEIHAISFAGEPLGEWSTPLAHHMFTELPDGTLAWQATDIRSYTDPDTGETDDWVGDAILETTRDGTTSTVFSTWDALEAHTNDRMLEMSIYRGQDWTHGNMLRYEEATGEYLLSLGHADDVLFIDRASGDVGTIYGTDGLPASPAFDYQHDVNVLESGNLLMFMSDDDGAGAVEYAVADDGLSEVWRSPWGRKPFALGEARRLANGNTYVNGGAGGDLTEVTPDGEVVWELTTSGSAAVLAQFQLVDDLYSGL